MLYGVGVLLRDLLEVVFGRVLLVFSFKASLSQLKLHLRLHLEVV